ncbi:MAG: SusC/RagA family TonB-linked outer membrane protein, partial [Gemmatimonadaceae bacterium]
ALASFAGPSSAGAQQREITGKVTVAGTNAPLQDAIVGLVGSVGGARTNDKGEFRLKAPNGDVFVQVRAIGYKRQSQRLASSENAISFALEKDVLQIEGVTVTGAATTVERKNAATAVSAVNSEELARVPAPALESALQGKVVGASINMNNGAPGGGGQVQIRGASSLIGNVQPLFVIDGVIISNATRSNRLSQVTGSLNAGEENGTNRLADINPNDIENIEVLKGAAASAIYGSQATNGVVVITTKRGSNGSPRFNITQRVGGYQAQRILGSRHFQNADQVLAVVGGAAAAPEAKAAIAANCTASSCNFFDYQNELYGEQKPSYETVFSTTGGINNTRYFFSGLHREENGVMKNTSALRQSLRGNLDQAIGNKWTVSLGSNILRSYSKRGISNNDNALSSPIYAFGYTPAILDLRQKDAAGRYVLNPFPSGYLNVSNPFQTADLLKNDEDVYRMIFSGRVNFDAYSSAHNNVNFTLQAGADRFSSENYIVAPQELQFQRAGTVQGGTFPGMVVQGNGTNLFNNMTLSGLWNNSNLGWASATTSGGLQLETRRGNDYNIQGRGLGPAQVIAAGAANTQVTNQRTLVQNQAFFAQEELLMFGERLYVSGAVRGERSSVNADRQQTYYFPRFSGSYRFIKPISFVNELKLRVAYGQSGNQPNYGERDLTFASYGLNNGLAGYGLPGTIGNSTVRPERLKELEYGLDAGFLNDRVRLEATYYNRDITDLLVRPTLAPSSGITTTTLNGGVMNAKGYELGLTTIPFQSKNAQWTSRANWFQNKAEIVSFPAGVKPFRDNTAARGFGNSYGQIFYSPGHSVSTIWGNGLVNGVQTTQIPLADANPHYVMSFSNDFNYKRFNVNVLVDYRHGGTLSNMTKNLYDEGGNSWDYDDKSPTAGVPLGQYRYDTWNGGRNTAVYLEDGSYTKVREVSVSWDLPQRFFGVVPGARSGRLSLSGRNLFIISGYNGFDPEVNNGGAYVVRFVDLAPFPPTRSFFLSVDLGW